MDLEKDYTKITQEGLNTIVREALAILPDAGESYVIGTCRSRKVNVSESEMQ